MQKIKCLYESSNPWKDQRVITQVARAEQVLHIYTLFFFVRGWQII